MLKFIRTQGGGGCGASGCSTSDMSPACSRSHRHSRDTGWKMTRQQQDASDDDDEGEYKLKLKFDSSCQLEIVRLNGSHFKNLTHLNLCENNIQKLDLLALGNLEWLQCSRNHLVELSVNGSNLKHLAADHNKLQSVSADPSPAQLQFVDLSHNELVVSPEKMLRASSSALECLRLGHNRISTLPTLSLPYLVELSVPANQLRRLPNEIMVSACRLRVLNVSRNAFHCVPSLPAGTSVEELYLTSNHLESKSLHPASRYHRLRVLHAAYNGLTYIEDSWVKGWPDLEELVLSGNKLTCLPTTLSNLPKLRIVRAHSNHMTATPTFSASVALRHLDLSHNRLGQIHVEHLINDRLQILDLSYNLPASIDPTLLQNVWGLQCRPVCFVSVRAPDDPVPPQPKKTNYATRWSVGFSETPDSQTGKLCIAQLRLMGSSCQEVLFGVVDSSDPVLSQLLAKAIPKALREEQVVDDCGSYIKFAILAACRQLRGRISAADSCPSVLLGHVYRSSSTGNCTLRAAVVGSVQGIVVDQAGVLQHVLGNGNHSDISSEEVIDETDCTVKPKKGPEVPDPLMLEFMLEEGNQIIVANRHFWDVVSAHEVSAEFQSTLDTTLAAKRLQDLAQGYGCSKNVSVLVLRGSSSPPAANWSAKCNVVSPAVQTAKPGGSPQTDRSSPSGQSDGPSEESNGLVRHYQKSNRASRRRYRTETPCDSGSISGTSHGTHDIEEEQFKCWEYILEENTHKIFRKEIDTLSKGMFQPHGNEDVENEDEEGDEVQGSKFGPFLSRYFGSARSFLSAARSRAEAAPRPPLGGPNAAYFGSLQRLMPHGLEYNFEKTRECNKSYDSLDYETRLQRYWDGSVCDVKTTEL